MKPFDVNLAMRGHPVCTRDNRDARIICFDRKHFDEIIALVCNEKGMEDIIEYLFNGRVFFNSDTPYDLFMKDD